MLITRELNQESVKSLLFALHNSSLQTERKYLFIVSCAPVWFGELALFLLIQYFLCVCREYMTVWRNTL